MQKMDDKESSRATYDHEKQENLLGLLNRRVFLDQDTIVREKTLKNMRTTDQCVYVTREVEVGGIMMLVRKVWKVQAVRRLAFPVFVAHRQC